MKKVVVFGGGTGISYLLKGLKEFPLEITAVISVSDNGRSTGKLREEFNMPAVGDLRKVIVSLANVDDDIKQLLSYRFNTYSDLNGHPIGNLIMVGMYNISGSLKESIETLSQFLGVKHKILPISEENLTLMGITENDEVIEGEENITLSNKKFKKFLYENEPHILNEVKEAVMEANLVIFSIGSLYTSILPHLLCSELVEVLDKTNAKIMYTCNAVTQPGETDDFKVSDHVNILNKYLGKRKIDVVVASNSNIPKNIVEKYSNSEQKDLVEIDEDKLRELNCDLIEGNILIIENEMIRHDGIKTANMIFNYLLR